MADHTIAFFALTVYCFGSIILPLWWTTMGRDWWRTSRGHK